MKENGRVVVTGTVYNLLLNLLIIPEEEIASTLFFTCDSIPYSVRSNLKKEIFIPDMHNIGKMRTFKYLMEYRVLDFIFCPRLNHSRIYAQDHLPFMSLIVGERKYAFTEDGPNVFKVNEKFRYVQDAWELHEHSSSATWLSRIINPLQGGIYARNDFCDELVVSEATCGNIPDYALEKKVTVVKMKEIWDKSSDEKKQQILKVFDITSEDINLMKSRHIVVFTQPFFEDGDVPSLEEQINVYREVLSGYNLNDVIIKTHPREKTDYKKFFPEVVVFNKPVPFQLLDLIGLNIIEAATVCSTAALSLPNPVKINWVGAKIHPGILKEYGDFIPEQLNSK